MSHPYLHPRPKPQLDYCLQTYHKSWTNTKAWKGCTLLQPHQQQDHPDVSSFRSCPSVHSIPRHSLQSAPLCPLPYVNLLPVPVSPIVRSLPVPVPNLPASWNCWWCSSHAIDALWMRLQCMSFNNDASSLLTCCWTYLTSLPCRLPPVFKGGYSGLSMIDSPHKENKHLINHHVCRLIKRKNKNE